MASSNNQNKEILQIHYYREDGCYKNFAFWLWEFPSGMGKEYHLNGKDSGGVFCKIPLKTWSNAVKHNNLGLIVKSLGSWDYKDGADRIIKFDRFSPDKSGVYHIYLKEGSNDIFDNPKFKKTDVIYSAKFINFNTFEISASNLFYKLIVYRNGKKFTDINIKKPTSNLSYKLLANEDISLDDIYEVEVTFKESNKVSKACITFDALYRSKKFEEKYNYDGELGAIYSPKSTTFKVWSPVSNSILLRIYKSGTPNYLLGKSGPEKPLLEIPMKKDKKGVFSVTVEKDLEGKYYTYVVSNAVHKHAEIVDPYAKSGGINGLRGMIVDFSKTNPYGFKNIKPHEIDPKHLTVYETHIADLTASKTWTNNKELRKFEKTFLGACIEGTTYTEKGICVSTGFDNIKELGVNAVQLLPIFDQANDEMHPSFNWGYNPNNYNILEGAYSTNPFDGYARISEFKQLVKKYHDAGINIIMDVVYNHVNGVPGSNFDVLMPGYYFRYNNDGLLSNGSGCGNETASELPMMRKFIVDSVSFLAKEYKLGGFRFDLMGLHDLKTMEAVAKALKEIDKNIVVYGEPWCGGGSVLPFELSCNQANLARFKGYGAFNDKIRDTLVHLAPEPTYSGWVGNNRYLPSEGEMDQVCAAIQGCISGMGDGFDDPNKQVNYVTCHDNHTMYDKLIASNFKDESEIKKVSLTAHSIIFTSNGISFMLAGEEFLRSKKGVENSYNSPYEINAIDYSLKIKNYDLFKNFQKLIKFKQEVSGVALGKGHNTCLEVKYEKGNMISYELNDENTNRTYKVFHLNGYRNGGGNLVDLTGYKLYLDTNNSHKMLSSKTLLVPYETLIVYKENK